MDGVGYELLLHAAAALRVDVVLVLGQDKLVATLRGDLSGAARAPDVVKLTKSDGVVIRPPEYRRVARGQKIKEYFYGPAREFSPASLARRRRTPPHPVAGERDTGRRRRRRGAGAEIR